MRYNISEQEMFELNDGNHRHEAYTRLGITGYPVIVWITEEREYRQFTAKYAPYLTGQESK